MSEYARSIRRERVATANRKQAISKQRVHNIAKEVLSKHKIDGNFRVQFTVHGINADREPFVVIKTIRFTDPKLQFLYNIKGGHTYFIPLVHRAYYNSVHYPWNDI